MLYDKKFSKKKEDIKAEKHRTLTLHKLPVPKPQSTSQLSEAKPTDSKPQDPKPIPDRPTTSNPLHAYRFQFQHPTQKSQCLRYRDVVKRREPNPRKRPRNTKRGHTKTRPPNPATPSPTSSAKENEDDEELERLAAELERLINDEGKEYMQYCENSKIELNSLHRFRNFSQKRFVAMLT